MLEKSAATVFVIKVIEKALRYAAAQMSYSPILIALYVAHLCGRIATCHEVTRFLPKNLRIWIFVLYLHYLHARTAPQTHHLCTK
jgi:hypothetical protein